MESEMFPQKNILELFEMLNVIGIGKLSMSLFLNALHNTLTTPPQDA